MLVAQLLAGLLALQPGSFTSVGMACFVRPPRAAARQEPVRVPAGVKEFIELMKRLTPSKSPTDTDRAIRDDRKSDLAKVLDYVGPDGVDFVGFTNEGVTRAHPTVTRHVTREQLAEQIRTRQGEQLRWLIDLSHVLRWWANRPGQVERGEKDQVVVIFEDEYVLDFRDSPKGLRLTKLRMLRDPDGGD